MSDSKPILTQSFHHLPVLLLVEGPNDVEFLRCISRILYAQDRELPDLGEYEERNELVILPLGGNGPRHWIRHLLSLGRAEFFLFDREMPPETENRRQAIELLNAHRGCHAVLTGKRSLENYLHPRAIEEVTEVELTITDDSSVPDDLARALFEVKDSGVGWETLSERAARRLRQRAKSLLNTRVVERMTVPMLNESDRQGEVRSWLTSVQHLIDGTSLADFPAAD